MGELEKLNITNNEFEMLKNIAIQNLAYITDEEKIKKMLCDASNEEILEKCYYSNFMIWCLTHLDINTQTLCCVLSRIAVDYFTKKINGIEGDSNEE